MPLENPNRRMADRLAGELEAAGVRDLVLSPGSRSSALVLAFARRPAVRRWVMIDERSAGFFALGLARERGRAVAILCTSGTAAANLLPAVVEASLSAVPLLVLTADRPPELRDCRAAQTIRQVDLFAGHVRWAADLPTPSAGVDLDDYWPRIAARALSLAEGCPAGPVHLNLPMREPLFALDEELAGTAAPAVAPIRVHRPRLEPDDAAVAAVVERIRGVERGLVICGPGAGAVSAPVLSAVADRLGWPILADPLSGLRFTGKAASAAADAYDLLLRHAGFAACRADAVLRFGAPPTSKALERWLAATRPRVDVLVSPPGVWPDPGHRATDVVQCEPAAFLAALDARLPPPRRTTWQDDWTVPSRRVRAAADRLLDDRGELFEGGVFRVLRDVLPEGALLHVGNSMPVRDLDSFLGGEGRAFAVACNRGANGIDGVVSTAAGAAAAGARPTVLVLGDLSFLHDVAGLYVAARHRIPLLVVVIDNDGGGIFSFLPPQGLGDVFESDFATPHGLDLESTARAAGARFVRVRSRAELRSAAAAALGDGGLTVIAVPSDRRQNVELHRTLIERTIAVLDHHGEAAA